MTDRVFSDKLIEKCTVDFLPNKVLFAMGDSDEIKCASIWIKQLEKEIGRLGKDYIASDAEIDRLKTMLESSHLSHYKAHEDLMECQILLRRFLPKDESDWDQIIQLTQTEKGAMDYFRRQK